MTLKVSYPGPDQDTISPAEFEHLAQVIFDLTLQLQESLFVMPGNDPSFGRSLKPFQPLCTLEPSRVISRQPALRNSISPLHLSFSQYFRSAIMFCGWAYVFNNMTVVTDEEECPTIRKVDLHPDQTIGVARQVVECDTLAKFHRTFIECFPI